MAPSELAWQTAGRNGCRSTAPWPASGAGGLELRPRPQAPGCSSAYLRELRPGAAPRHVAQVGFDPLGRRRVTEQLPSGRMQRHDLPGGGAVRLRWEKAAGWWKLWVEEGAERLVLEATFESPEPQLELYSTYVDRFDFSLLPPPEIQSRLDESTRQAIMREKQDLQNQLDESKRRYELLAREKAEETQKAESAQHEKEALQQRIESLMAELETEKEQKEIAQTLQKQLDELAQEKAEEMKKVEGLQQENEILQQRIALLTQKAQKSEQMTQRILHLKEHCDDVLAFSRSDADPQAEGPSLALGGSGEVPTPKDASDVFSVVGESEHSDASSRSAKCFLPNTALHGVDGHLLRVEKLKIGDRVRLLDHSEAAVVGMHLHRAKKKPYGLVELTTRQGLSTVSKSHRVAVPAGESEGCEAARADQLSTGGVVVVGGKSQKLTKVASRQERTNLYEVRLDPDGPLEMLHLPSFGLATYGSLADLTSSASASGGLEPAGVETAGEAGEVEA
ncbi:unnamed protein product [Effrenium voratum]|nr:unnamed protein product [Effrenium voratum]